MSFAERWNRYLFIPYAAGTAGLGCVGLAFGDFALQWQPVPPGIPGHHPLALANAVILLAGGVLLVPARTRKAAAIGLAIYYSLWALVLHAPRVAAEPANVAMWLGLCEIGAIAAGAFAILGEARASPDMLTWSRRVLGAGALVFGLSHLVYAGFTASMVPRWIPAPLFWAYATGAGHGLAGLSLVSGIRSKLAALCLAAMCGAFVLLLHVPRVLLAPDSHAEWTMLFVATAIAGAALALLSAPERRKFPKSK